MAVLCPVLQLISDCNPQLQTVMIQRIMQTPCLYVYIMLIVIIIVVLRTCVLYCVQLVWNHYFLSIIEHNRSRESAWLIIYEHNGEGAWGAWPY